MTYSNLYIGPALVISAKQKQVKTPITSRKCTSCNNICHNGSALFCAQCGTRLSDIQYYERAELQLPMPIEYPPSYEWSKNELFGFISSDDYQQAYWIPNKKGTGKHFSAFLGVIDLDNDDASKYFEVAEMYKNAFHAAKLHLEKEGYEVEFKTKIVLVYSA